MQFFFVNLNISKIIPAKYYETPEEEQGLIELLTNVGFKIVGGIEKRSKFVYI